MKKILVIAILVLFAACKEGKKETSVDIVEETEAVVPSEVVYPKLTDIPKQLNYIFKNGFEFSDDIKINYIALLYKGGDNYQLIYGLNEDTNLKRLETLKISANFYAEDASLFKEEIYKKRKSRQVPMPVKINMLDDEPVISQKFTMLPKKHNQVKFYFYSNAGVENDRMLTVRGINMPI